MQVRITAIWICVGLGLLGQPSRGGEIPGLPPSLPPFSDMAAELYLGNDVLGRGGSVDDFRTQQVMLLARLDEHWTALVDHSILTLDVPGAAGRLDQMSVSVARHLIDRIGERHADRLLVGGGLRSSGDFQGERIQNGFHRLIDGSVTSLPYSDTSNTDLTAWLLAERYRSFGADAAPLAVFGFDLGYWLRGASLHTTRGRWDGSGSAYLTARGKRLDLWLGLKHDWRSGYDDDLVLARTADAESATGVTLGLRFGALVFETHQQFDSDASFGQLSFVASARSPGSPAPASPRAAVDVGMQFPDAVLRIGTRYRRPVFLAAESAWRESALLEIRYGEPQYKEQTDVYVTTRQISAGLDVQRALPFMPNPGVFGYVSAAAGWRYEEAYRIDTPGGQDASRGVAVFGAGLRTNAGRLGRRAHFQITLGLEAILPLGTAAVALDDLAVELHRARVGVEAGISFQFE